MSDIKYACTRGDGWERLDAEHRTMWGIFAAEGYSSDPIAMFDSEMAANRWLTWVESLDEDDDMHRSKSFYCVCPVRQLSGVVWNSIHPVPDLLETPTVEQVDQTEEARAKTPLPLATRSEP